MRTSSIDLFDLSGEPVATLRNETLVTRTGRRIGTYLSCSGIIIDEDGAYFGEIVLGDRLICKNHPARDLEASVLQRRRAAMEHNVHSISPLPTYPIARLPGFADVPRERLGLGGRNAAG